MKQWYTYHLVFLLQVGFAPNSGMIDDDDDSASVTSDRSAFSISSEMSVTPYATSKYPNPITVRHLCINICNNVCICVTMCTFTYQFLIGFRRVN